MQEQTTLRCNCIFAYIDLQLMVIRHVEILDKVYLLIDDYGDTLVIDVHASNTSMYLPLRV